MLLEALLGPLLAASTPPATPPAAPPPLSTPAAAAPGCPADMERVRGVHHEQVQRLCLDFRDGHCFAFLPGLLLREPRVTPLDVCMDRYEWPNRYGALPRVMLRFVEAEAACASVGKRLCTEAEWELACEGPRTLPWPYGFSVRRSACHTEQPFRPYDEGRLSSPDEQVRDKETGRLYQGVPSGSFPSCQSPFGVFDLVGNVEEWILASRPQWPFRSALKGGYWSKPWAACRGTNERHGPAFRYYQIGFRCCKEPRQQPASP
jgi:hypothetical protein